MHGLHTATSKDVNSVQGSSCKLKFVHERALECLGAMHLEHARTFFNSLSLFAGQRERERDKEREREIERERERERGRERVTGALAPFSNLVILRF